MTDREGEGGRERRRGGRGGEEERRKGREGEKRREGGGEREVLENFEAGYLLRTKGAGSAEGGVAAGFGSVDSCCLVDV